MAEATFSTNPRGRNFWRILIGAITPRFLRPCTCTGRWNMNGPLHDDDCPRHGD